jgi:aldose 1-epimerase
MAKVTLGILEEVTVPIALEIFPKGLTVHRFQLDTAAVAHDIVPGPYDEKGVPSKYVNTVIGRYSNRIPVSSEGYTIEKGGYKNVVKPIANGTMCF